MTTRRFPTTAPEILARAAELGHVVSVRKTGPWPEHGDPHPKWFVSCECGKTFAATRSEKSARASVTWHLGRAIGEGFDQTNGQEPARPPVRAAARREDVRATNAGRETP